MIGGTLRGFGILLNTVVDAESPSRPSEKIPGTFFSSAMSFASCKQQVGTI